MEHDLVNSPDGRRTRLVYVIESSIDNCISAVAAGVFFTMLLKRLGISDSLTGIISSLSTLACIAQMFSDAIACRQRSVKHFILSAHVISHLLFLSLYILPFLRLSRTVQIAVFIVCYLGGSTLNAIIYPRKFTWLMSYVADNQQGRFTADREIVVLISGMLFNYGLSALVDDLNASGRGQISLLLCGITIAVFSALHIGSLGFAADISRSADGAARPSFGKMLHIAMADAKFRRLLPIAVIYTSSILFSSSFYTVYQLQELHFSMKYIALLTIIGAVTRALVSRPLGRFADRHGWAKALKLSFLLYTAASTVNIFCVPSNGKLMFLIYTLLIYMGSAVTSSGIHTILFSYVPRETLTTSIGIYSAVGGLSGFGAAMLGGLLVDFIQKNGNHFMGLSVYAQQVTSAVSALTMLALALYMSVAVYPMKTLKEESARL